jgi:O-antigen ligase
MTQKVKNGLLLWGLFCLSVVWLPGAWLPFHTGKWLTLGLLALLSSALWCFRREITVPDLQWKEKIWLGILFGGIAASLLWFHGWYLEFSLLDRLTFFLLVYFAWTCFRAGLQWREFFYPLLISLFVVSFYGLFQLYQEGFPGEMPYTKVGSFLGHSNNAAQFVGLGIFLLWVTAAGRTYPAAAATAVGLAYLYLSRGRSALVAFALAGLVAVVLHRRKIFGKVFWLVATVALLLIVAVQIVKGFPLASVLQGSIFREKPSMVTYREDVWRQTLEMIGRHPLGVGVDKFSFRFVPFHQRGTTVSTDHIALSPHNEFLRYPAEDGIPLALFFLCTALLFLQRWYRATAKPEREAFYPFLVFFFFEMVFQFPFQNPLPTFFLAIFVGYGLSKFWQEKLLPQRVPVLPLFFFLFAFLVGKVAVSRMFETSANANYAQISCAWAPANWQGCLNYSRILMAQGRLPEAREVINGVLERDPANFTATRHLGVVAFRQGRLLEGCFHSWSYDYIFGGKSDIREAYEKNCPLKFREYFDRKKPTRYYHRE